MNNIDKKVSESEFIPGNDVEYSALAYIKPVATDTGSAFAVCASDGTQLAIFNSRDAAMIAARQHDLDPVNIH